MGHHRPGRARRRPPSSASGGRIARSAAIPRSAGNDRIRVAEPLLAQNADMSLVPDAPAPFATHEVTNQVPPLVDYDVFASDAALVEAVERFGAGPAAAELSRLGRLAGTEQAQRWGDEANRYSPVLRTH